MFEEQRHMVVVLLLTVHGQTRDFTLDQAIDVIWRHEADLADADGQLFAVVALL